MYKERVGIIGGSFDPIHYGHLILAEHMRSAAGLDRVILVPARISPFKLDTVPAPAKDRTAMVKLAIEGYSGLSCSDEDTKREGPSYTYEGLLEIRDSLPNAEISYIVGSDSVMGIDTWHRASELLRDFPILTAYRPGGVSLKDLEKRAQSLRDKYGARIGVFGLPELEISSSDIRQRLQSGRSVKYLLPDKVLSYINEKHLYRDLIALARNYAAAREKPTRFRHTEGVVKMSKELAKLYGADAYKAELAAWFHDTSRDAGNLEHGFVAALDMETNFNVTDPDIINAVRYHTTGRCGMCLLEKILKIADNLEEGREYEGVEDLRRCVKEDNDIDVTLLKLMKHTKAYVEQIGAPFAHTSDDAIEDLEKQIKTKNLRKRETI